MAKYNIGGYIFDDENKARKAAKELKTVEYILGQLKDVDEKGVLAVYKKLLGQKPFSTEIGMSFLLQLRQNLLDSGVFAKEDIPEVYLPQSQNQISLNKEKKANSIPAEVSSESENKLKEESKKSKDIADKNTGSKEISDSDQIKKLKTINRLLLVLCITLLLCVIGMFYINSTINSPTILNYEEELLNKYSTWEQELSEREAAVKEKELEQQ